MVNPILKYWKRSMFTFPLIDWNHSYPKAISIYFHVVSNSVVVVVWRLTLLFFSTSHFFLSILQKRRSLCRVAIQNIRKIYLSFWKFLLHFGFEVFKRGENTLVSAKHRYTVRDVKLLSFGKKKQQRFIIF